MLDSPVTNLVFKGIHRLAGDAVETKSPRAWVRLLVVMILLMCVAMFLGFYSGGQAKS